MPDERGGPCHRWPGLGIGNLAVHKRLRGLLWKASYADKRLAPSSEIAEGDNHRPAPVRHYPFVEERAQFTQIVSHILA